MFEETQDHLEAITICEKRLKVTYHYENGDTQSKTFLGRFRIGRNSGCEFQIRDENVSRNHAELYPGKKDHWIIRDIGSTNGIRIDGVLVAQEADLPQKAQVTLGKSSAYLEIEHING